MFWPPSSSHRSLFISSVFKHSSLIVSAIIVPSLDIGQTVSTEPGLRIMLVQLRYRFLSGISITFLKDAYGPFTGAISLGSLIVAVRIPTVKDGSVKFIPLQFVRSACHFLSPASKNILNCRVPPLTTRASLASSCSQSVFSCRATTNGVKETVPKFEICGPLHVHLFYSNSTTNAP